MPKTKYSSAYNADTKKRMLPLLESILFLQVYDALLFQESQNLDYGGDRLCFLLDI